MSRTMLWLGAVAVLYAMQATPYDPLKVSPGDVSTWDGVVSDAERSRDIPVRVYLPETKATAPVVLFSHGLGGSDANDAFLGQHWAKRGYVAVFMQHAGSDAQVWKDAAPGKARSALEGAASLQNFLLRVKDVPAVIDGLTKWNSTKGHDLFNRLDVRTVGMSGHSFGAVTTQAVSGETFPGAGQGFTDARIKAAVMFSPSVPKRGDAKTAFGGVKIPWLLMTGTRDASPIGNASAESRRGVFPELPKGGKYEVVLNDAEHSAFSDRALPGDSAARNPNHHRVMLALTTAFFDAYLKGDAAAKAWLDGAGPRAVLEAADTWKTK